MPYLIVKKTLENPGEQILLFPPREGDQIYEFPTLEQAQSKIGEISSLPIYSDCILEIIEDIYGFTGSL